MDFKSFDTSTPTGWESAIKFEKNNPEYKLINSNEVLYVVTPSIIKLTLIPVIFVNLE